LVAIQEIKEKVLIPDYFYNVILKELRSYYANSNVNFELRPVVKCPLHDEDTPSFRWYPESNTFYCFGCNEGGDVITLHMKFWELHKEVKMNFTDSLLFLRSLLTGQSAIDYREIGKKKEEEKSEDIIKLSKKVNLLEENLKRREIEQRNKYYSNIDSIFVLISSGKINYNIASCYLDTLIDRLRSEAI
jgi:DNA primase